MVPAGPYVDALVDPRDDAVFYVGKGKGRRMFEHEREARRGDKYVTNREKRARIDEILAAGLRVKHTVIARFCSDAEAFKAERELIDNIPGLTNRSSGRGASSPKELSPELTLASAAQDMAEALADTLVWKPQTPESQQVRAEHIASINLAMAMIGQLAAELAAPPRH